MSFYDDASLVVIPSAQKTSKLYAVKPTDGSGDLTFTRTGDTATRVNSAGLIEEVRTNYARQSQSFATAAVWTATNGTLTNNAGTAPDGTNTASKIVATNTDPFCYQSITLTGPVVASCYVKAVGSAIGKSAEIRAGVSLTAFTLSGSWQRVSVTHTASGAHNYGLEVPNPGVIGDEVLLWGFQVEGGDVVTNYIPTTTAAVSVGPVANVPRLDYLGSTCPRLLLEPQRTNLLIFSEQFNNGAWALDGDGPGQSLTANFAVSPDGYQNADRLQLNKTGGTFSRIRQSATGANTYTFSVYMKSNTSVSQNVGLRLDTTGANNVVTTAWQRFTLTATVVTPTAQIILFDSIAGNNEIADILIWGAQLEAGAYATSYIPTLAASATRGADFPSKSNINALIGGTSGTVFFEIKTNSTLTSTNYKQFFYYTGASSGQAYMYISNTNVLVTNPSFGSINGSLTFQPNTIYKIALAYATNDFKLYINGVARGTSTSGTPLDAVNLLSLGSLIGSSEFNEFTFAQYLHFKTRLTNAELAELTTL